MKGSAGTEVECLIVQEPSLAAVNSALTRRNKFDYALTGALAYAVSLGEACLGETTAG